jgi:hypothetical protein
MASTVSFQASFDHLWPNYARARDHAKAHGRELSEIEAQVAITQDADDAYTAWLNDPNRIGEVAHIPIKR